MVKSEEKSLTAPLALPSAGGRKARKASRTGAAARLPIVRAQIRLPNELNEKMPSAPCTPVNLRKEISASKLVESHNKLVEAENKLVDVPASSSAAAPAKKVPKSVASMVRRFELEATTDAKSRAGVRSENSASRGSTPRPSTPDTDRHTDITQEGGSSSQPGPSGPFVESPTPPSSSRSSSVCEGYSPGPVSSNEVPHSSNAGPEAPDINQDSSFTPPAAPADPIHEEEEDEQNNCSNNLQTNIDKKITASSATDRVKKSGGTPTSAATPSSSSSSAARSGSTSTTRSGGGGGGSGTRNVTSSSFQNDRAKMSTSGSNCRPGPGNQSAGFLHLNSQKPATMNSVQANKKSSTVIGVGAGGGGGRSADNTTAASGVKREAAANTKPTGEQQAPRSSSLRPTMQKKSVSADKKQSTIKKTISDDINSSSGRRTVSLESQKKTLEVVAEKDRGSAASSAAAAGKKTSVTKQGLLATKKPASSASAVNTARKPSQNVEAEKQRPVGRRGGGSAHKPVEKTDSSVSLVRKKFEKKHETNTEPLSAIRPLPTSDIGARKLTEPLPKVKISQNVFLKEDAQKRKPKAKTQEVGRGGRGGGAPVSDRDARDSLRASLVSRDSCSESENDSVQTTDPRRALSRSVETVPSPQPPCEDDDDLSSGQTGSSHCIQKATIIHSDDSGREEEEDTAEAKNESGSGRGGVGGRRLPDLNIDDAPCRRATEKMESCARDLDNMDMCDISQEDLDRIPDRLAAPEPELPESPAYRSPLLSDDDDSDAEGIEEPAALVSSRQQVLDAFAAGSGSHPAGEEPTLRNKLLSNLVNKRSESDGIVCMDRPKAEQPVRRCESIDDSMDLISREEICSTVSFPQSIKTLTPATIMKGPEDYTAGLTETVYLRAHYFGNPEPGVAWYKGGRRLNHTDRINIRTYPGESTLVIRDLRADDSGKYDVQIENEMGNDSAAASLCVEGPPEPPGGRPYITTIDKETLRLTLAWYGSIFDGGSMLTGYIVEMSSWPITNDARQPEPTDWTILTSKCHSTSYIVRNLDSSREYIFRVRAKNIHGPSKPGKVSEPVSFMKLDDDLDEPDDELDESDDEEFDAPFEHRHVTLEEGTIFKNSFDIYEELGRGRFGVVFKVRQKETREVFAAKFVRCRKQEEREKCKEEISIMNGLDHGRLLQLAAAYENPREVIMIMEFIGGGELFEKVVADDFTLTEHDCVLFMRQICAAIGYMHQKDIVHLDLKPENILCKSKKSHQIKIIDFGLTRKLKPGEDVRILFGTPEFVSPEVISYEPVSASSDMWSVGVVCYVLLSGLSPFMGDSDVETFANITGMCYDFEDEAFEHISEDAKDFILKLLVKDQRKRLKALECLKHPWLTQKQSDKKNWKEINTDKLKSFLMRRRWQKAAHAIRALGRFTSLGFRQDTKDSTSSITALSTQSADF